MPKNQIVQNPSMSSCVEPIESWQIISVERVPGDDEPSRWGEDGRHVVAWFDLGEAREQIEAQPMGMSGSQEEPPEPVSKVLCWFRTLFFGAPGYRLAGDAT